MYDYLNIEKETKCEWLGCEAVFATQTKCFAHVKRVHIVEDTLVCKWDECGKECNLKSNLTNHLYKHIPIVNGVCYLCDRMFKWRGDSRKHLLRHTVEERGFNDAIALLFTNK